LLLRFVVHNKHWRSGRRSGLFQAVDEVVGGPEHYLYAPMHEIADWFAKHLEDPFKDADKRNEPAWKVEPSTRAISWVKASATDHVSKMYELKALVEEAGWMVEVLQTTKPGAVLYEDEYQVIAAPYADTPT
jgi:hypothetical protein